VLKRGGSLLIRLPAYRWLSGKHDRAVHTRHRYTAREVRQALVNANFAVERISYVNSVLFPVPLIQRTMERIVPWLERPGSDLTPPGRLTNTLLRSVLESEAAWLRRGGTFAWGLSVLCLARRPVAS